MDSALSPQCAAIAPSLAYNEVSLPTILTLAAFLLLLNVLHDLVDALFHAGILAQLVLGAVFGAPLANILSADVQSAVQAFGYLGLLLLVVEGGMTTRLDILSSPKIFFLCLAVGMTGIAAPIVLSMILLPFAYHFTFLESFVAGAALSSTSLGITLAIISKTLPPAPSSPEKGKPVHLSDTNSITNLELGQDRRQGSSADMLPKVDGGLLNTRVGTILIGAAVLDDIVALVLSSVIASLGAILVSGDGGALTPWKVVRPILSSALLLIGTIFAARFVVKPAAPWIARQCRRLRFRSRARWIDGYWPQTGILLWVALLCGFVSLADVIDSTTLIGAFCVGAFTVHAYRSIRLASVEEADVKALDPSAAYAAIKVVQERVLSPFFFASIGFAIPVRDMFQGMTVWEGVLYGGLMGVAKVMACLPLLIVTLYGPRLTKLVQRLSRALRRSQAPGSPAPTAAAPTHSARARTWPPAMFLGFALVTRGEIGFLIINIGREVGILSCTAASSTALRAFNIAIWAIMLNTFAGPIVIGILSNNRALLREIERGPWGIVSR